MKKLLLTFTVFFSFTFVKAQTTHTINLPSSGTATINVNCSVGDVLLFQSTSTPFAIRVFRNPLPNYTLTPTGNSTSYTVTASDTSYSSIVSLTPVTTCVGKIILSTPTAVTENNISDLNLKILPNPTSSFVRIDGLKNVSLAYVFDVTGKGIMESKLDSFDNKIDLSSLKTGIYFIRINNRSFRVIRAD